MKQSSESLLWLKLSEVKDVIHAEYRRRGGVWDDALDLDEQLKELFHDSYFNGIPNSRIPNELRPQ